MEATISANRVADGSVPNISTVGTTETRPAL